MKPNVVFPFFLSSYFIGIQLGFLRFYIFFILILFFLIYFLFLYAYEVCIQRYLPVYSNTRRKYRQLQQISSIRDGYNVLTLKTFLSPFAPIFFFPLRTYFPCNSFADKRCYASSTDDRDRNATKSNLSNAFDGQIKMQSTKVLFALRLRDRHCTQTVSSVAQAESKQSSYLRQGFSIKRVRFHLSLTLFSIYFLCLYQYFRENNLRK